MNENKSASVFPESIWIRTRQAEEAKKRRNRWKWVERSIWTDPMLATLEKGIKGGKWFSLMDKVCTPRNLRKSWHATWRNKGSAGVDRQTVEDFDKESEREIHKLSDKLRTGTYEPKPALRAWIEKPGSTELRPLGIPVVADRVVQGAIRNVIEPIFERIFHPHSYGLRPGRGCMDALRRVETLLHGQYVQIVEVDFKSYFDTIPQDPLIGRVKEHIADGSVLSLLEKYLKAGVMDEMKGWEPTDTGTPQGAVISPLLANLYLNDLDHHMARLGYEMTRYADDFVVQCQTKEQAEQAMEEVKRWAEAAGLTIHPTKTRIVDATEPGGFDFLGYHFERGLKWPREKSLKKLKDAIREETPRNSGTSIETTILRLNRRLRGWHNYFQYSVQNVLEDMDGWIRRRLRSILERRAKKKGNGKGKCHQRWPNSYFDDRKLFSLTRAKRSKVSFA